MNKIILRLVARRLMSSHVQRTKDCSRNEEIHTVEVSKITRLSPTVKAFELSVSSESCSTCSFKAGQWLDVHVPVNDATVIGGYSITTTPTNYAQTYKLDLAIQYSDHPPTHWMHTSCIVGSKLKIKVGGDFYYDATPSNLSDLVLIAGGIGINPLYSVMCHQTDLQKYVLNDAPIPRTRLLYSARTEDELIFKENITKLCSSSANVTAKFFVTREASGSRIGGHDISKALGTINRERLKCYVCGPAAMIADVVKLLQNEGINEKQIFYEKWW